MDSTVAEKEEWTRLLLEFYRLWRQTAGKKVDDRWLLVEKAVLAIADKLAINPREQEAFYDNENKFIRKV